MNENTMELVEMDDIEETMEEYESEDNEETESTDNVNADLKWLATAVGIGITVGALAATKGPKLLRKGGAFVVHGFRWVGNMLPGKKHHEIKSVQKDEVVEETVEEVTE